MQVREGMQREHSGMPDSDVLFHSANGMRTTSRDEYEFVACPRLGKVYPERPDLYRRPQHCRRPQPPEAFGNTLRKLNAQLSELGQPSLLELPVLAALQLAATASSRDDARFQAALPTQEEPRSRESACSQKAGCCHAVDSKTPMSLLSPRRPP